MRRFMPVVLLLLVPSISLSAPRLLIAPVARPQPAEGRVQYLLSVDPASGGADTLTAVRGSFLTFSTNESRVYRNRYVLTDAGDVFDLEREMFLRRGGIGKTHTRFVETRGDSVVLDQPGMEKRIVFDLASGTETKVDRPPGSLSPDGRWTAMMESDGSRPGVTRLRVVDASGSERIIATGLTFPRAMISSFMGGPPFSWVDEGHLVTLTDDTHLVTLDLQGHATPLATLALPDYGPAGGVHRAWFDRDDAGDLVYSFNVAGMKESTWFHYLLDVDAGTCTAVDRIWYPVGNDFSVSRALTGDGSCSIRHGDRDLGVQPFLPGVFRTAEGRIAMSGAQGTNEVLIWTEATGAWRTLSCGETAWLPPGAVVGWVD